MIYLERFSRFGKSWHFYDYLNFVVFPHGVLGYLIDLVRPPWGWSTGLRATPLTLGFRPYERQNPLLVFNSLRFSLRAQGPKIASECIEKNFRTPDGKRTKATYVTLSNFMTLAEQPALRTYWTPEPGFNSMFEIFLKAGSSRKNE